MQPGPELDALIAEHIFGCIPMNSNDWETAHGYKRDSVPRFAQAHASVNSVRVFRVSAPNDYYAPPLPYSTDIRHAFEIVDHFSRYFDIWKDSDGKWFAQIGLVSKFRVEGISAPHVICLAALKAIESEFGTL